MDLTLTEEQRLIVDMVRRFVRDEIVPLEAHLDPDADELWSLACIHARQRVVVKRSRYAPALGRVPDLKVSGKAVRYDIYLRDER